MFFQQRDGGKQSGPFVPLLSIFPIPCIQTCLALCRVLFSSTCSAQLSLALYQSNEPNGQDPQPSLKKTKYLAQDGNEESDGCAKSVAHKDSKP